MAHNPNERQVMELQREGVLLVEDGNHGEYRPRRDEFSDEGTAFIRAADMDQGRILFESASRINDVALNRIRKGIGAGGDVLLSHKGTVGKIAYAPLDSPPFVCSPQTTFWRSLDTDRLDRRYLYAYMRSEHFHRQLRSRQNETDMAAYVSLTAQRDLQILLPEIHTQRDIAGVLGSIDKKIEVNSRTNRLLQSMARAVFKSWFIDFEPVKVKAAGGEGFPGMRSEVFGALPEILVDSELGEIPDGWGVSPIGELVDVVGGGTPSTKVAEYWEGGDQPFCTPKEMSRLSAPVILGTERKITQAGVGRISSGQLPIGTIVLSSRAPIGYLAIAATPLSVNQGIIAMPPGEIPSSYVLFWTESNIEVIKARASGSTFAEISKRSFRPIPALRPGEAVLTAFDAVVSPMLELITNNERESRALASCRDTLLPKLISGEVHVATSNGGDNGG